MTLIVQAGTALVMIVKTRFIPLVLVSMGIIERGNEEAMKEVICSWEKPVIWFSQVLIVFIISTTIDEVLILSQSK